MRFLTVAALSAAFIASVSSKINFGPCRTDVPQLAFDDYEVTEPYIHRIAFMDRQFFDLFDLIEQLGFQMPLNYVCDDLATVTPFLELATAQ
jgi:hypothetical protein